MTSHDRPRKPSRSREERDRDASSDDATGETAQPESNAEHTPPFRNRPGTSAGHRIWVLPMATGDAWTVAEEPDVKKLASSLCENTPTVLCMRVPKEQQAEALRFASEGVAANFRERTQEKMFSLISRLVISGGWLLLAMLGLRLPGEVKSFDQILLLAGLGFLGYTIVRHAIPFKLWNNQRDQAVQAIGRGNWQHSALIDRLSTALKLRKDLKVEERGQSPDTELLDANAYRKLIRDGLTTREELSALGQAIEKAMKLHPGEESPRKIADIARECGLDTDSAIFYRDLAAAAAEIRLDDLGAVA